MATENDDSQSMNGILSNISRDVVDTSWDIPPLTFPKLQPTDSEEADGADETSLAEPRTLVSRFAHAVRPRQHHLNADAESFRGVRRHRCVGVVGWHVSQHDRHQQHN